MPIGNLNTSRRDVTTPVGTFADKLMQYGQQQEQIRRQDKQLAKEDERFQTNLGFKQRAEDRGIEETQLKRDKELANNEAMKVILYPDKFSPEEREAILSNQNIDQSKLFDTKSALYQKNVNTPGTPEFIARQGADRDQYTWKGNQDFGWRKQEIGLNHANSIALQDRSFTNSRNAEIRRNTRADNLANDKRARDNAVMQQMFKVIGTSGVTSQEKETDQSKAMRDFTTDQQITYNKGREKYLGNPVISSRVKDLYNKMTDASITPELKAQAKREFEAINTTAHNIGLGASGSGVELKSVPDPIMERVLTKKPSEQYNKELMDIINNPNTSAEAVQMAVNQMNSHSADSRKVMSEEEQFNLLAERAGANYADYTDPKVAKFNAQEVVKAKTAEIKAKAKKSEAYKKSLDTGSKIQAYMKSSLDTIGRPDFFGSGQELGMIKHTKEEAKRNKIPMSEMETIMDRAFEDYNGWMGNHNSTYEDRITEEVKKHMGEDYVPKKK